MAATDAAVVQDPLKIPLGGLEVLVHFMDNTSLKVKVKVDSTVGMLNVVLREKVSMLLRAVQCRSVTAPAVPCIE